MPDPEARRHILGIHVKSMPFADDVDLDEYARRTERYTGADLEYLTRRAGLLVLRESFDASVVSKAHFDRALEETRASETPEMEREYEHMLEALEQQGVQRQPIGFLPARTVGKG